VLNSSEEDEDEPVGGLSRQGQDMLPFVKDENGTPFASQLFLIAESIEDA
jgi:hypothetical protein